MVTNCERFNLKYAVGIVPMNPRRNRSLLSVEKLTVVDDGFGDGPLDQWDEMDPPKRWFSISTRGGREYERAGQMEAEITHLAHCEFFEGADSSLRLRNGTRIFNVKSVVNKDEQNRWLVWQLVEGGA